jgi:hypothetical protein
MARRESAVEPDDSSRISRDDIENKFRQLTGDLNTTTEKMTRAGIAGGVAAFLVLLVLVFVIGKRKGIKKTTIVEVIRI